MSALHLVCRLVLPAKGRRGCRRRPTPLGLWPLADPEACKPTLAPTPDETKQMERS